MLLLFCAQLLLLLLLLAQRSSVCICMHTRGAISYVLVVLEQRLLLR